ncbi:MAG: DNA repair protein RecN [Vicinamibacterales bacterium]|nr:DNA repair protein RecN [Vicinamibacterales bacterium]
MLRYLNIKNLAVIESLEVSLQPGFNVLTGETGAGKSIVVGAVGLLLGDRASPEMIRTGEEIAIVQAVFDVDGREILIRRELAASGRSRSFVDDVLVTAGSLRELGARLVDLHGQHEHQALLDPQAHLDLLDRYAGLTDAKQGVAAAYGAWVAVRDELEAVRRQERDKEQRTDFLRFQLQEIDRIAPLPGEDEQLLATRHLLANAEKLRRLSDDAYDRLYEGEGAVTGSLAAVWRRIEELSDLDPGFKPFLEGRDTVDAILDDLAGFLREYGSHIEAAPERLQDAEDRLALLERLKRKYGPSLGDVLLKRESCAAELDAIDGAGARLAELESSVAVAAGSYLDVARRLSASRRSSARAFARALERELADLAMERTRFEVRFVATDERPERWTATGLDEAEFFVSPNPGEELKPLAKVASGGELSRVMLALKTLASTDSPGKTLIFDEVDAGIGGRVADVVGRRLQALGRDFQVLCITHLPQIAASGASHYRVSKAVRQNRTTTSVTALSADDRVDEIARMMAGSVLTDGTRASAREMLDARRGESGREAKGESESLGERRKRKSAG